MNVPRTTRWGLGLALLAGCISGLSIFLNGLMVKSFPDPTLLAGVRNGFVGLLFITVLVVLSTRSARSRRRADRDHVPSDHVARPP